MTDVQGQVVIEIIEAGVLPRVRARRKSPGKAIRKPLVSDMDTSQSRPSRAEGRTTRAVPVWAMPPESGMVLG